jgi:hypothetical protein
VVFEHGEGREKAQMVQLLDVADVFALNARPGQLRCAASYAARARIASERSQ